jgi:AcrR family transcriptional regulator
MGRPQLISDENLLAIAREVFRKHGVFGSTKEIAQRAGVSEAAIFKRFSTKAQLFMAAMVPPTPGIDGIIAKALSASSARAGLHALAEAVLDYFRVAIPMILPLVTHPTFGSIDLPRNFETSPARHLLEAVAAFLRSESDRGRMKLSDAFGAAVLLVSAVHSIALFEIMGLHGGTMPPRGLRAMVDALWLGLDPGTRPTKRRRKSK